VQQRVPSSVALGRPRAADARRRQAAVYLARAGYRGRGARGAARGCHAPARRIARTTISLGHEEGEAFGLRAIRRAPRGRPPAALHLATLRAASQLHTLCFCQRGIAWAVDFGPRCTQHDAAGPLHAYSLRMGHRQRRSVQLVRVA